MIKIIIEDIVEFLRGGLMWILILGALGWFISGFGLIPIIFCILGTNDKGESIHILVRIFLGVYGFGGWVIAICYYINDVTERRDDRERNNKRENKLPFL